MTQAAYHIGIGKSKALLPKSVEKYTKKQKIAFGKMTLGINIFSITTYAILHHLSTSRLDLSYSCFAAVYFNPGKEIIFFTSKTIDIDEMQLTVVYAIFSAIDEHENYFHFQNGADKTYEYCDSNCCHYNRKSQVFCCSSKTIEIHTLASYKQYVF